MAGDTRISQALGTERSFHIPKNDYRTVALLATMLRELGLFPEDIPIPEQVLCDLWDCDRVIRGCVSRWPRYPESEPMSVVISWL